MQYVLLPTGTLLYHGTSAKEEFAVPRGPAWFTKDEETAREWMCWKMRPKHERGRPRVLTCRLLAALMLVDTVAVEDWEALGLFVLDDTDPITYHLADSMAAKGLSGWFGNKEVLIVNTSILEGVRYVR